MNNNQLFDLIQSYLTPEVMDNLSTQLGNPEKEKMSLATTGILNTLIGALGQSTKDPSNVGSLFNAITRDHEGGNLLDNLVGILSGKKEADNRQFDGLGILMHLLGNKTTNAVDMVTNLSGMDRNKTSRLMIMLAPMVMAALGKMKSQQNIDQNGLANLIQNTVKQQQQNQANPTMALITKFLDKDGDGKIKEELAGVGMKMLKNFLKK